MCGIVGILRFNGRPVEPGVIEAMANQLKRRGPDDMGVWAAEGVGLGHRRLSIIDLSASGHQPFASRYGNKTIVFNGEIYNYLELKKELEDLGYCFKTSTDTEVLLFSYLEWGEGCLTRLCGMFAFAIWDADERCLFLSRDRLGKKPVYIFRFAGGIAFSSELKGFYPLPEFEREIKPEALHYYFSLRYIPAPLAIWKDCEKLKQATWLKIWSDGREESGTYWQISDEPDALKMTVREKDDHLYEIIKMAVKQRLRSDVPVGAFLSGGIDSSLVAALMAESLNRKIKTFTISFAEKEFDEGKYAKEVADILGTDHHEFKVNPDEMLDVLPSFVECYDEPFADQSAIPTMINSRIARSQVTVALTGDGGDEPFLGYERFLWIKYFHNFENMPYLRSKASFALSKLSGPVSRKLSGILRCEDGPSAYAYIMDSWKQGDVSRLLGFKGPDATAIYNGLLRDSYGKDLRWLSRADICLYLPDDILCKVDRASMWYSLEVRSPLLDHRVIEWALKLTVEERMNYLKGKLPLRNLLRRYLPSKLINRGKKGFAVPIGKWFKDDLKELVLDELSEPSLRQHGLFDSATVKSLLKAHMSGADDFTTPLWQLLVFQLWYKKHAKLQP